MPSERDQLQAGIAAMQAQCAALARAAADGAEAHAHGTMELACYRVLAAAGDARAAVWLDTAHAKLMRWADRIADPVLRQGYLENHPDHREIVSTRAAQTQSQTQAQTPAGAPACAAASAALRDSAGP